MLNNLKQKIGIGLASLLTVPIILSSAPKEAYVISRTELIPPLYSEFEIPQETELKEQKIIPGTQKAFFLTGYSLGNESKRHEIYNIIENSEMNAIVFNAKDDSGIINYNSNIPLAHQVGAVRPSYNIEEIVQELDERDIYSIARIVTFKDRFLAKGRPDLAIKDSRSGAPLLTEKTYWPDPYSEEVWDYNISIVKELAEAGVDEVQFDYIRFPARGNVKFAQYNHNTGGYEKVWAIENFLKKVREETKEYGIKISADLFGFVFIANNDQGIGQKLENLAPYLDYIYPMPYPSHYGKGFLGFDLPEAHPYEVVKHTLEKGLARIGDTKCLIVPWIQAFGLHMTYTSEHILAQIKAAEDVGINGYLCWNAANKYGMVNEALKYRSQDNHPNNPGVAEVILPNELGNIMVLEYHNFDYAYKNEADKRWKRTYDDFRKDLERLYENGYRLVSIEDAFINNNIQLPAGQKPVTITFDDGSKNQLKFKEVDGELVLDNCAVKVMFDFFKEHPDFGIEGEFFLNGNWNFGNEHFNEKVNYLVNVLGMDIGNHTHGHANLSKIDESGIPREMVEMIKDIKEMLPEHKIDTLALPFGIYPKTDSGKALVVSGSHGGVDYFNKAVFLVGANPSHAMNHENFDPKNIPRIQAIDSELDKWLEYFEEHPEKVYVSDGNNDVIMIPYSEKDNLDEDSLDELELEVYFP